MGREDWYRNETWNEEISAAFFEKLKKSRSQKTQNLKIQAYYLLDKHPEISIELIDYARKNCPDEFYEQEFCLYESQVYDKLGKYDLALEKALESIKWRNKHPGHKTNNIYWLARLVLKRNKIELYKAALDILEEEREPTPFPSHEYEYFGLTSILINRINGDTSSVERAKKAVEWASMDKNLLQNPRKRYLGVFKRKPDWPHDEIQKIANSKSK
jgi:tetratricopeptide (TPR) repeat protein